MFPILERDCEIATTASQLEKERRPLITVVCTAMVQALCTARKEPGRVQPVLRGKQLHLLKITASCAQGKSVPAKDMA